MLMRCLRTKRASKKNKLLLRCSEEKKRLVIFTKFQGGITRVSQCRISRSRAIGVKRSRKKNSITRVFPSAAALTTGCCRDPLVGGRIFHGPARVSRAMSDPLVRGCCASTHTHNAQLLGGVFRAYYRILPFFIFDL